MERNLFGRTAYRFGERVRSVTRERPAWGATLLALGHLTVLCSLVWSTWFGTSATATAAMGAAVPLAGIAAALAAVGLPRWQTTAGAVGAGLAGLALAVPLVSAVPLANPKLLVFGLVVAGVGGLLCTDRQSVRLRTGPALRVGQLVFALGIVVVLAANAPVMEAQSDPYPQQEQELGGFVVFQDSLFSDRYDFVPACPGDGGDGCINSDNYNIDSTTFASNDITSIDGYTAACEESGTFGGCDSENPYGNYLGYIQLNNASGDDNEYYGSPTPREPNGEIPVRFGGLPDGQTDFFVYKNYYNADDGEWENFEISGDRAKAVSYQSPGDQDAIDDPQSVGPSAYQNAVGVHVHEYRSYCLPIDSNIFDIENDNIDPWTVEPGTAPSDSNSINDVRQSIATFGLNIDARPILVENQYTEDISLTALQLASTETEITDFRLTVEDGRRGKIQLSREPLTPGGGQEGNCPTP